MDGRDRWDHADGGYHHISTYHAGKERKDSHVGVHYWLDSEAGLCVEPPKERLRQAQRVVPPHIFFIHAFDLGGRDGKSEQRADDSARRGRMATRVRLGRETRRLLHGLVSAIRPEPINALPMNRFLAHFLYLRGGASVLCRHRRDRHDMYILFALCRLIRCRQTCTEPRLAHDDATDQIKA